LNDDRVSNPFQNSTTFSEHKSIDCQSKISRTFGWVSECSGSVRMGCCHALPSVVVGNE
jgi:hypothetical protein